MAKKAEAGLSAGFEAKGALLDLIMKFGPKLLTAWPLILQLISILSDGADLDSMPAGFNATPEFEAKVQKCCECGVPEEECRPALARLAS